MKNLIARFQKDESGATAIEYGLIAGFVSIAIITALLLIGPQLSRIFQRVADALTLAV
jgi:pilus assembly protein Flp/PilA